MGLVVLIPSSTGKSDESENIALGLFYFNILFHIEGGGGEGGLPNKWLDLLEPLCGLTCAMLNNQTYGQNLNFLPESQIKFVLKFIRLFIFLKQDFLHGIKEENL